MMMMMMMQRSQSLCGALWINVGGMEHFTYHSFDVMKTSSLFNFSSLNNSVKTSPISSSLRYACAQSTCLYPHSKASFTALPTSPFLDFHVLNWNFQWSQKVDNWYLMSQFDLISSFFLSVFAIQVNLYFLVFHDSWWRRKSLYPKSPWGLPSHHNPEFGRLTLFFCGNGK